MTLSLLLPVKNLSNAKQRLAGLLSQAERGRLAWLMLEGVLAQCESLPPEIRKVMATNDGPAMELARASGFEVLREERQVSESDSVDRASAILEQEGVRGVLRVPLDLPLLVGAELGSLFALAGQGARCILVPSRDGTGTNGLYRARPTLFPSRFGPGSLALHRTLAREQGAEAEVAPLPSLALDIDDAADVEALLNQPEQCPARVYLEEIGVRERMAKARPG